MKLLQVCFLFILTMSSAEANDIKYPFYSIPKNLLENAHAVLRIQEMKMKFDSPNQYTYYTKYAYTILSKETEQLATLELGYDKRKSIKFIKGTLFDALGNEVRSLKKADIKDESAIQDFSLYEDNRVKTATLMHNQYPYTVEFEYEVNYGGAHVYFNWYPKIGSTISIEQAICQVTTPKGMKLRFKEMNLEGYVLTEQSAESPKSAQSSKKTYVNKGTLNDQDIYTWKVGQVAVKEPQYLGLPWNLQTPHVRFAPDEFEYDGYKGNMSSWESYGKWQNLLNEGRVDLPEATKAKIKELTANEPDKVKKIKKVYEYLQNKTRYISIQLGIGGNQPFPASYVDEKSYGDCKALSNYTHALLKAIDIESYYTIVKAGEGEAPIIRDFPSFQFNHVILTVPLQKDTVFLECTSQTQAFGYLGDFTSDRDVVIVTPQGGKLVHTTVYTKKDNVLHRKAEVKIDEEGNAIAQVTTDYKALQEGNRDYYVTLSQEEQKKWLYKNIELPNFDIQSFSINRKKDRIPCTTEKLQLSITKLASKSGKRLFLVPNLLNQHDILLPNQKERTSEVYLNSKYDFRDVDTIQYIIPEKYQLEYKPEDVDLKSPFGKYSATVKVEGNKVIYIRTYEMNRGTFPKESYQELADFWKNVTKADKTKIVFVNKEG